MPSPRDELTIGEVAERSGVAHTALRFYEERGLIASTRNTGNQRRYRRTTLRRIAFIRSARRVGLTLEEIGEALATLPSSRTPTRADWARLSQTWRSRLDEQIERLERLRDQLDGCIGCGCLSLDSCALSNPDDALAGDGPGAVRLEATGRGEAAGRH
ncbi:redox-sensitive transcriptional activator SoxR [Desertihabitans aurantiacus]|uniref:redox-sensitive transcriptional activator SoxR n=1 Tax=Desertihabitans aurantiacus TaxID=2282477 RepID=UPI000DF78C95|nr:redox-sensitive transcriptional activator SoxR [Desertihabitans aurantiacus]